MMANKRNTRPPRRSLNERQLSEQTRRRRYESQPLRNNSFDPSHYGRQNREGSYASAYSRSAMRVDYSQKRQQQKRKRRLVIVFVVLAFILTLALIGAKLVFDYFNTVTDNLHEGLDADLQDHLVETDLAKEPFYMLLMGTDGSNDRAASEEFAGDAFRSDSMMLVRIDPINKKVTMVSLQRDTLVDMGEYGQNKLNAAHALGGASLTVQVVSDLAGVPISHYAEINFDGFRDIVNALGGVEVNVPIEINDEDAGGYLAAGLQTLNGDQALILCRARHAYDEIGIGGGDIYRAANQRLVLAAIAKKVLSSDLATMASTISSLSEYVTTDLEILDIVGLAQVMRGLDPATDIYSAMEPTTPAYVGEIWYEYLDTEAWRTMMDRVDQGLPPTEEDIIDESTGTVMANAGSGASSQSRSGNIDVKNGSGVNGVAAEAGNKLKAVGYTVEVGNADANNYPETLIIYRSADQASEAEEIASILGRGTPFLNDGTYIFTSDFLVVIGANWV